MAKVGDERLYMGVKAMHLHRGEWLWSVRGNRYSWKPRAGMYLEYGAGRRQFVCFVPRLCMAVAWTLGSESALLQERHVQAQKGG
jgi:hypothetical protein